MSDERPSLDPDTAAVGAGHDAADHLGSLKPPIYETSTFAFETAQEGQRFFELVYGLDEPQAGEEPGYIYSRLDNPNLAVAEARLAAWEGAETALVFNSGMAAISTLALTLLRPGETLLHSSPIYGGTETMFRSVLARFDVGIRSFRPGTSGDELSDLASGGVRLIYVETPANPTNDLYDIELAAEVASRAGIPLVVDNTFLSPIWQKPLALGADLVVHSATKYLGGHSDLTAGAVCGAAAALSEIRHSRYRLGTTASPGTAWLLGRSLETLGLRMRRQTENAIQIASHLEGHPKVSAVRHLSLLTPGDEGFDIYKRQCLGPGAMIALEVAGEVDGAHRFLDGLEVVRLAVSLGGTESLASHPWTMSHSTLSTEEKLSLGVTPGMVRLSVGIEAAEDLIADISQALGAV